MKETLISVGIDVGTTTTQVIFSNITIENMSSGARVPEFKIVGKEIFYKGKIHFTPLRSNTEIDETALKEIIENHQKKYPNQMLLISIPQALVFFEDAEESENPISLNEQTWKNVQRIIKQKVNEYLS